ncbi:hypothetical protein FRC00_009234, partial [Tulasnella sp. 408]
MRVHGAADADLETPVLPLFAPNFFQTLNTHLRKYRQMSPNGLAFLFSCLKSLQCVPFTNFDWKGFEFFLRESPQLSTLDISSIERRFVFEWPPLLQALSESSLHLKDLTLEAKLTPQTVPPSDLAELASLIEQRGIEELTLHDAAIASPQVLTALANSPSLRKLTFLTLDNVSRPRCKAAVISCGFSALTSISGQFMSVSSMLHATPFSELQEINVKYPVTWDASARRRLRLSWNPDSIRVFLKVAADHAPNLQSLHFQLVAINRHPSTQD